MSSRNTAYKELKNWQLPVIDKEVLDFWQSQKIFEKSITSREDAPPFVFYEGPPSANGLPGIHHVMARAIKDLFCRYKTMKGFKVDRKGGWDTHGLPVELQVEKKLGIKKDDIGSKISVEEYNKACREEVLKFKDVWDNLTVKMGYWVDLENPYITFENDYIETIWYLLKKLYKKDLLYKGYTIQPYSPAAGTGLSSHELSDHYHDVTDTTVVAQFKAIKETLPSALQLEGELFFLAWTTTPWTLPSNTALTVGPSIDYAVVKTTNQYTKEAVTVILAQALVEKQFTGNYLQVEDLNNLPKDIGKKIPYQVLSTFKGKDLVGAKYEQLFPWALPHENAENAFKIIDGDFVTTSDGTGIVHTAPTFGADDARVAKQHNVPGLLVLNQDGKPMPLVDLQGRFVSQIANKDFAGKYVKNEYYKEGEAPERSTDVELAILLKTENRAFKVEKYVHSYPHCWRTDKPILYYPLDSWFIRTTAVKDKLLAKNAEINWKPASTGEGRFGNWLANLVDWNLSRSRFWGTPLPIWRTEDGSEELCIGSIEELRNEVEKARQAGFMQDSLAADFDLHKPYVDNIYLVSPQGNKMFREPDLIDVWFDSGAMPYAQWHYPFEKNSLENVFPADFIAEGVDQTRGWFFTLHAIGVMLFDSVAFKNVVSNGLVLDKKGNKMSKRLGNAADPFKTIDKYGADATRWYIISNSQPWDNLKFDSKGIEEVQRKFFGTLLNTYSFFALYANIDGFTFKEDEIAVDQRPEIDRWIISLLNTLCRDVEADYDNYEPTWAARKIQSFVTDHLSNWYVRLSRRRFWKGEYEADKISAYQTLYTCLDTISRLMAPIAPFTSEYLFNNLNKVSERSNAESVHISQFPKANNSFIDKDLEHRMQLAQAVSSMTLSLRKLENIKVRQPLQRILLPINGPQMQTAIEKVSDLIKSEVNVKEIEFVDDTSGLVTKSIKPNFKTLGKKLGPKMKAVSLAVAGFGQEEIREVELNGQIIVTIENEEITLAKEDLEIASKDLEGWLVTSQDNVTVALDVTITEELEQEGLARELVNKIQNLRKNKDFNVTDRIKVIISTNGELEKAINNFNHYICSEVLAEEIEINNTQQGELTEVNDITAHIELEKV